MKRSKDTTKKIRFSKIEQRNIFYMLLYNSNVKYSSNKRKINKENLKTLLDYMAYVMCQEFKSLQESGLVSKFNRHNIQTDKPRGKLDMLEQYRKGSIGKFELQCSVQRLDINNFYNKIIKTAMKTLLVANRSSEQDEGIAPQRVGKLMYYIDTMDYVDYIENIDDIIYRDADEIPFGYEVIYNVQIIILRYWQPTSNNKKLGILEQYDISDQYFLIYERFVRSLYHRELKDFDTSGCTDRVSTRSKTYGDDDVQLNLSKLKLEPDCLIADHKNKRLLIIDTKWYNSLAENYSISQQDLNDSKYNKDKVNKNIGIYNQQIGKSCLYAMAYKSLPEYKDYDVCTLVLLAKNLRSSGNYKDDEPISHQIAFYKDKDNAIDFQIAVVHHTMDMNFKDIKNDLLNVARRFLSDDPLNNKLYTLR